jgi:RNA polymerase sigma-B factor
MAKGKRKAPDRDEVNALIREYRQEKDTLVRDRLIAAHLYLVQTAARKFAGLGESHEDLLQEGSMGLVNAVDLYDPDRGVQFSTYATHLVEGQIRHYLRDRGKLIKQPAWVQELTTKIVKASEALTQELDRPPTPEEIAERVETTPENIQRMLEARERSKVASLDAARDDDDEQGPAIDPEKLRTDNPESAHLPIEDRIFLREAMSKLKELERKVVHNFYYLDLNQTEIARKLGISVNYASYLLRGAVTKLKKAFEAQEQAARIGEDPEPPVSPYSLSARTSPTDPVTKVADEGYLIDRIEQEVMRASRYPQQFAVVLVEPDWEEVDRDALVELSRLLRSNCRSIDLVARLGRYRFGLLLPHTGREASVLSERICRTAAAKLAISGRPLTASSGFAVFPTNGRTTEDLLAAAAGALLEAKEQGGGRSLRAEPIAPGGGQARPAAG